MTTCPQCRKEVTGQQDHCPACGAALNGEAATPASSLTEPQGKGLGKAITRITSRRQKARYVVTGIILSAVGFFVASIPLGTATLVVGRILLRNRIKGWGYLFCGIGTLWAVGLPILNLLAMRMASLATPPGYPPPSISIIPQIPWL